MQGMIAGDAPCRGRPGDAATERRGDRAGHPGIGGEAEIVAGGEVDRGATVSDHFGSTHSLDLPDRPMEPGAAQDVQLPLERGGERVSGGERGRVGRHRVNRRKVMMMVRVVLSGTVGRW